MKYVKKINRNKESGAVSLFIVVFTALLITVLTISFVQLMIQDQKQATTTDLSQSAYDSAAGGVEDAKRLLLREVECRGNTSSTCQTVRTALANNNQDCDLLDKAGISAMVNGETMLQQSSGDGSDKLDQAYTCVTVSLNTDDVVGHLSSNDSKFIPLQATSNFNYVEIEWFTRSDLPDGVSTVNLPPAGDTSVSLPRTIPASNWPTTRPPLLRAQIIQHTNDSMGIDVNSFDGNSSTNNNAHTLFLYPQRFGPSELNFSRDKRLDQTNGTPTTPAPAPFACSASLAAGGYACKARLQIPPLAPGSGGNSNKSVYLNLGALYNSATYRITLWQGAGHVQFKGVQPAVDSTGRANDLFRRVESRVELHDSTFPYPRATIDLEGNLCKNFVVTDRAGDYRSECSS